VCGDVMEALMVENWSMAVRKLGDRLGMLIYHISSVIYWLSHFMIYDTIKIYLMLAISSTTPTESMAQAETFAKDSNRFAHSPYSMLFHIPERSFFRCGEDKSPTE
jgi:hypothetical protein